MFTHEPNCSIPTISPAFVESPNVRGTLDILWSCLGLLVLGTWSILFLNIPIQGVPRTRKQKLGRAWYLVYRKIRAMVLTLFAPELLVGKAFSDFASVNNCTQALIDLAAQDDVPWSRMHSYYADMGGFILWFTSDCNFDSNEQRASEDSKTVVLTALESSSDGTTDSVEESSAASDPTMKTDSYWAFGYSTFKWFQKNRNRKSPEWFIQPEHGRKRLLLPDIHSPEVARKHFRDGIEQQGWKIGALSWRFNDYHTYLSHTLISQMGTDEFSKLPFHITGRRFIQNLLALENECWVMDANMVLLARRQGLLARLPDMTEATLKDKDKGDAFVKLLALFQFLWMIVHLIGRHVEEKAISHLEITVLAFSICAMAIYCFNWSKPKDVSTPTYIRAARAPKLEDMKLMAIQRPSPLSLLAGTSVVFGEFDVHHDTLDVREKSGMTPRLGQNPVKGMLALGSSVFGGIHLIAWNFPFPSDLEMILWRASSIATTIGPFIVPAIFMFPLTGIQRWKREQTRGKWKTPEWAHILLAPFVLGWAAIYVGARVYLIVESFRTLWYLPPDAFEQIWTSEKPRRS